MRAAFVALTIGGILMYSGLKGLSIAQVLAGEKGETFDPASGAAKWGGGNIGAPPATRTTGTTFKAGGGWGGTKNIADAFRAVGEANGLHVTSSKRPIVMTTTGNESDHWVGNLTAYAYDMNNGRATKEMDATVSQWCAMIGVNNTGKNKTEVSQNITVDGQKFRVQILYRTTLGGDHFSHCHVGVKKL